MSISNLKITLTSNHKYAVYWNMWNVSELIGTVRYTPRNNTYFFDTKFKGFELNKEEMKKQIILLCSNDIFEEIMLRS